MRVAALYDIHGNLPALEAVLAEVEAAAPDLVVVGGDVVAGPLPGETLERLVALGDRVRWVMGNADRRSSTPRPRRPPRGPRGRDRPPRCLGRAAAHARAARPAGGLRAARTGRTAGPLFCHGSPRSDSGDPHAITPRSALAPILDGVTAAWSSAATRHDQSTAAPHGKRLSTPARRHALRGRARRPWLRLGPDPELRRTDYDLAAAIERLRATGLPEVDELMLRQSLLEPVGAAAAARTLEARATA